ncbi:MAG: GTPase HflX [Actinobacteria bacterium]|nr:GTPase HflX [Actinomycetota bacterium]MBO0784795.1 GTPase HflX [Actinomycetota bacterium]
MTSVAGEPEPAPADGRAAARPADGAARDDGGELDLLDRHALRRVAGLSTELEDISEVEYRTLRLERVVLIGVWADGTLASAENSLRELSRLAETAGSLVLDGLIQRRSQPDPATYVGAGKASELAALVVATGADTVICDGELSPSQLRRLEGIVKVKVIDRTALILDIFAQHARSKEGKAQVELAQLQYLIPRLRGWGESLSRQAGGRVAAGGGIGARGPGETKLETDRRRIRTRTAKLRRQISEMSGSRKVQRGQRRQREVPSVAIAGYTNAGKSSLLNALTGAGVLVEDALFATLDPAVRRARTPGGRWFTLTDTVGFVRHLPHQLVDAFRSTLEEVAEADLVLHVVDGSDADPQSQIAAVREVLTEIGAADVPEVVVINKSDVADPITVKGLELAERGAVLVSARTGAGVDGLLAAIEQALPRRQEEVSAVVPYERADLVARAHEEGEVLGLRHGADGTELTARVPPALAAELGRVARPVSTVQ